MSVPTNGNRTIVAVDPMAANASNADTSLFCRMDICRSLTIQNGKRPNTQSAMTLRLEMVYVSAFKALTLMHFASSGSSVQKPFMGLHWNRTTKKKAVPKITVTTMMNRTIQMCGLL